MARHMNPRQFKKLCAKCHALVVQIKPGCARSTHSALPSDHYDWHPGGRDVLKGTLGFGGTSGYYEVEWWDKSAWEALTDIVFSHFVDWLDGGTEFDFPTPDWPAGMEPKTWRDYLALGAAMAQQAPE